ncbi:hypothetical protein ACROYT_G038066 [Oculina patagonica]
MLYRHHVEHCNNPRNKKNFVVADIGVGLLVQPFYTSLLIKWLQQSIPSCSTYKFFFNLAFLLATASFFGVVAVSVDRFLAIHLHLRYQELLTHKRVVAVVILIWVLCHDSVKFGQFFSSGISKGIKKQDMQAKNNILATSAGSLGLEISTKKTRHLRMNSRSSEATMLNWKTAKEVEHYFTYLCSKVNQRR